jgi:hypothetical protein
MVKFTLSSLTVLAASTAAFAPVSQRSTVQRVSHLRATDTPLAPLTQWGSPIPDILSAHQQLQSKPLEFAPTIRASDIGLKSDDVEGQLEYVRKNKDEIKQKMVDCGAGEQSCIA